MRSFFANQQTTCSTGNLECNNKGTAAMCHHIKVTMGPACLTAPCPGAIVVCCGPVCIPWLPFAGAAMGGDNVDGDNDDDEAEVDTSSASDNDSDDNGDAVEAAILAAAAKQLKRARNGSRAAAAAAGAEDPDWANEGGSDSEEDEEGDAAGRRPHKRQRKARTAAAHAGQDWENDADEQGFMGVRRRRDA